VTDPILPHNREAEESLLGSILIAPEKMSEVVNVVSADDFFIHSNRYVWESFLRLNDKRINIDIVTVSSDMQNNGKLMECGGQSYITMLSNRVPSALNADEYAGIVAGDGMRRRVIAALGEAARKAYDLTNEFDTGELMTELSQMQKVTSRRTLRENVEEWEKQYAEWILNPREISGISTGLTNLDAMTEGLEIGTSTLLVGMPGLGKSTLADQIAFSMAGRGIQSIIYTLEISDVMILNRYISLKSGVKAFYIKRGQVSYDEQVKIEQVKNEFLEGKYALAIVPDPKLTTQKIRSDILRRRMDGEDVKFIVVDYSKKLRDPSLRGEEELDRQARAINNIVIIAQELKVAALIVHTLNKNKDVAGRMDAQYDPDNILIMTSAGDDPRDKSRVKLEAEKLRDVSTATFCAYLKHDPDFPFFHEDEAKSSGVEQTRQILGRTYQPEMED